MSRIKAEVFWLPHHFVYTQHSHYDSLNGDQSMSQLQLQISLRIILTVYNTHILHTYVRHYLPPTMKQYLSGDSHSILILL